MEEEIYYFRKEYFPKFKQPFSLEEQGKEDLLKAFFSHLRKNKNTIPFKFNFSFNGCFYQYTFESCKSKKENGVLFVKPIYKGRIITIEEQVNNLVSKILEKKQVKVV